MSQAVIDALKARFGEAILDTYSAHGDDYAIIARSSLHDVVAYLRDAPELAFNMLSDMTAVDYLDLPDLAPQGQRFGLIYNFLSLTHLHRVYLKVPISEDDPTAPTLVSFYKIANWYEREVWDMYGIRFDGHPDLRRLLMYDEFDGHPLRKDYPVDGRQPRIGPPN